MSRIYKPAEPCIVCTTTEGSVDKRMKKYVRKKGMCEKCYYKSKYVPRERCARKVEPCLKCGDPGGTIRRDRVTPGRTRGLCHNCYNSVDLAERKIGRLNPIEDEPGEREKRLVESRIQKIREEKFKSTKKSLPRETKIYKCHVAIHSDELFSSL